MRITLLAALALFALPAQAQVAFSPIVGFDLEAEGPMIGLAFEVGAPLEGVPLRPAIRPLVEYIFADDGPGLGDVDGFDLSIIRAQVDLIARFETSPGSTFLPYAKAGAGIEYISVSFDDDLGLGDDFDSSDTEFAVNIGGGAEFSRFFVEGGLGLTGIEGIRVRGGYRF